MKTTPRGYALTPDGRGWVHEQLLLEAAEVGDRLEPVWPQFLDLNLRFKMIVTESQQSEIRGPDHEKWPWLVESVTTLHQDFRPIVETVASVARRLAGYGERFDKAFAALADGDHSMLASPLKDSYHTVWFEYHEELIALSGRNRADEEAANPH